MSFVWQTAFPTLSFFFFTLTMVIWAIQRSLFLCSQTCTSSFFMASKFFFQMNFRTSLTNSLLITFWGAAWDFTEFIDEWQRNYVITVMRSPQTGLILPTCRYILLCPAAMLSTSLQVGLRCILFGLFQVFMICPTIVNTFFSSLQFLAQKIVWRH